MDITLPILSLLLIAINSVGIAVSIYIGFRLLNQKNKNHTSIKLLGIILIIVGITLFNDLLVTSGISNRFPWLYFIPMFYSLSIGPLFYLYIKSKYKLTLKKTDYLHLIIPSIQALVYFSIGFRSAQFKINLWEETSFPFYLQLESFLFPLLLIIYPIASLYILKKNNSVVYFWSDDLRKWLKKFAIGMLFIATIEFGFSIFETLSIKLEFNDFYLIILHTLTLSGFAFWIAINGLKQYFPLRLYTSPPNKSILIIDDDESIVLEERINCLMEKDHVFLNPDLNIQLLASYLSVSEKTCSYVLNQKMNTNFNTIVNEYRVEEFIKRLKKEHFKTYTLTSIAYECGFNSKSTFNRVFKLICGKTPTEYVKTI